MAIGTTNIRMSDIATELQSSTSDISMYQSLYASSWAAWNPRAGSYHNYNNMALSGLTDSFATAIEAKYTLGQDMGLKNWAGYDHDHNVILGIRINNGNAFNAVYLKLYLCDQSNGFAGGGTSISIFSGLVPANNAANISIANYNTTVPAFSSYGGSGYWIWGDIRDATGFPRPTLMSMACGDIDGVGDPQSCIRFNYQTNGSPGGIWDLSVGGAGPFIDNLFSGDQGNPFPNDPISWNKRTDFIIGIF
jgi:hypothetical protein